MKSGIPTNNYYCTTRLVVEREQVKSSRVSVSMSIKSIYKLV